MKSKIVLSAAFFIFCCVFIGANFAEAQTSKKKKKTTKPVVTATPVPQAIPQIISRADEFPTQEQIVGDQLPVSPVENTDDKMNKVNSSMEEMSARIKLLESSRKNEYDEKQKRLLLNLDILTRAEQRAENLRKQLFEMIEKQNSVQTRIEQITYDMQPSMIERYASTAGSLRPEEIREARRKSLESEKRNLESLMTQITTSRTTLEVNLEKADSLIDKLRTKLEKDIDDALVEKEEQEKQENP